MNEQSTTVIIPCIRSLTAEQREEFERKWLEKYRGPGPVEIVFQETKWPLPGGV